VSLWPPRPFPFTQSAQEACNFFDEIVAQSQFLFRNGEKGAVAFFISVRRFFNKPRMHANAREFFIRVDKR